MRVPRGLPSRRHVMTAVAVVASGGIVTVAMAAGGPVVYSEYTQGGERESRVALPDGGDVRLPRTTRAATVSPDGRRIAQVGATRSATRDGVRFGSWLRVTAADGSVPVTVVEERSPGDGRPPARVVGGRPVWSPDGTRVMVQVTSLQDGDGYGRTERLLCTVDARTCTPAGRVPTDPSATTSGRFATDVVAWQAQQGPLRWTPPPAGRDVERVRCGGGAGRTPLPEATVTPLDPAAGFGPALRLRGVPQGLSGTLDPATVGVVAVADGTLALDAPDAVVVRGALRCAGRSSYRARLRPGTPRLRLRTGGADVVLPTPPGVRAGDGLALVALADGGAALLSRPAQYAQVGRVDCDREGRTRVCAPGDVGTGWSAYVQSRSWAQRVWRVRPGARAFERVTVASRAALRTLKAAGEIAPADGDAVLALGDDRIDRVPLGGGAPTVVAQGDGLAFDLETP